MLNRDGESSGITYWVGQIDSGAKSFAKVLADFSESTEDVSLVGQTIQNGFKYNLA